MATVHIARPILDNARVLLKKNRHHVTQGVKKYSVSQKELIGLARNADALLTTLADRIDAKFMDACPRLRIVANYAVGYDNIDVAAATQRGIAVTNTPGVLTNTVAEHIIALMMGIATRICEADAFTRAGKFKEWDPMLLMGTDVQGKTIGIVGMGRIGAAVAQKAHALGMRVIYATKDVVPVTVVRKTKAKAVSFPILIKTADFVVPLVPMLPSTAHMFGAKEFGAMKKTAYFINAARGKIMDEAALADVLKKEKIRGAALDVYEFEPKVHPILRKLTNVILTPHIASSSMETRGAMARIAAENIVAILKNAKPPTILNPDVLKE